MMTHNYALSETLFGCVEYMFFPIVPTDTALIHIPFVDDYSE